LVNHQLSTEEDVLEEVCKKKINQKYLIDNSKILEEFSILYGNTMDEEEKPLYQGQDVFEDENDNYDLKFIDRFRITEETFHSDLFTHVFTFLTPFNLIKLGRVSKKWLKLSRLDIIWKINCSNIGIKEISDINESKSWYKEYLLKYSFSTIPNQVIVQIPPQFTTSTVPIYYKCFTGNHLFFKSSKKYAFGFSTNIHDIESVDTVIYAFSEGELTKTNGLKGDKERKKYHTSLIKDGDIVGVIYNPFKKTISFTVNDSNFGNAFENVENIMGSFLIAIRDIDPVQGPIIKNYHKYDPNFKEPEFNSLFF